MPKEFEIGSRYQGYAQTQGFDPIKPPDVTPLLRENRKVEQNNLQRMLDQSMSVMRINDQEERNAIKQQNDIAKLVSDFELDDLTEFSQSLTNAITGYQKYRQERDVEAGMALAYNEGLPEDAVRKFKEDEAKAEQAAVVSKGVAASLEAEDAPTDLVKRARNLSGWKAYGYARGIAQLAGDQYSAFYEEAADRVTVEINGRPVNLNNYKDSSEYAAVQAEIRRQYLKNFEGMNLGLLNEYLFPAMKRYEQKAATAAAIQLREQLQAERKTEMLDAFYGGIKDGKGGEFFIKLINQNAFDFGGRGGARKALVKELEDGLKSKRLTDDDVDRVLDYKFDQFGTGKLISIREAFARDLQDIPGLQRDYRLDVQREIDENLQLEKKAFETSLREEEKRQGPFTQQQLLLKMRESRDKFQGDVIPYLKDYVTRSDLDETASQRYAQLLLQQNGKITAAQARMLHPAVAYKMRVGNFVDEGDNLTPSNSNRDSAERIIGQASAEVFKRQGLDKGSDYEAYFEKAMREYNRRYAEYARSGKYENEVDIHDAVITDLRKDIKEGGKTYFDGRTVTTKSEKEIQAFQEANSYINRVGPSSVTTQIPGLRDATDQFRINLATGKGEVPFIFKSLATQMGGFTGWDLASAQHKAYGYGDVARPKLAEQVDQMSPAARYLLNNKPTPSRVLRAQLMSQDTTPFLELVKSKESKGYGEYDAMNRAGTDGGHTAIGSANSKDVFDKPLSKMTVGEVMKLQDEGKLHAAGAYQIIGKTMKFVVSITPGVDKDTLFDKATQDKLAIALYRNRVRVHGTEKNRLMAGLRSEWIGLDQRYGVTDKMLSEAIDSMSIYNQPQNLLPGLVGGK